MLSNYPVLLTYNEEQNISRTLSHLAWAKPLSWLTAVAQMESGRPSHTFPTRARLARCCFDCVGVRVGLSQTIVRVTPCGCGGRAWVGVRQGLTGQAGLV